MTIVHPNSTIQSALHHLQTHLSLPCADENMQFHGLISKRSIFDGFLAAHENHISFSEFCEQPATHCILRNVKTLTLEDPFESTIEIITEQPFVPIVENDLFLGIVKRSSIQKALSVAFATHIPADRLLLGVAETEGALERLFNITHRLSLNVVTCVALDAEESALNRRVILKVEKTPKLPLLVQQLEKAGYLIIKVN
ncbi:CBS domain-containing protein [Alicyclobacillus sp. TC]|uniref:CBS domain-containing protein n=1 Tax=Alicyclobacillus tolerans TaxID=90970 RepID=A0A1M6Q9T7_9BACL|nr:hypothetical protein [Alicyclobacillus montanus]QRF23765.1 CBS domain-containing protein [Alicyclobacillus sp. TC]SHK16918.1 hypothetical protein SAMN05443507_10999 [Alicyclobacillus montanus]